MAIQNGSYCKRELVACEGVCDSSLPPVRMQAHLVKRNRTMSCRPPLPGTLFVLFSAVYTVDPNVLNINFDGF